MAKCEGCGFLCIRLNDGEFVEVNSDYRKNTVDNPQAGVASMCFVMAFDLRNEFEQDFKGQRTISISLGKVLSRERDCLRFTPWHQGFTPKEHREMLFDLERKKLELQEKQAERFWTERREKQDRKFQLFNTLFSAFAGALFAALVGGVFAWLTAGKDTGKPPAASQPDKAVQPMPHAND